jgi:saccharopine dehydrogenase-like NADP-dependent oxidoreductase
MAQPVPAARGPLRQHEVLRVVIKGRTQKRRHTVVLDCHTAGLPRWGLGTDINTGCPPAIAARMLAANEISHRGVAAPETAVDATAFFAHLRRRRMSVRRAERPGWSFPA